MSIIDRIRGDGIQPTFTRDTIRSRRSCGQFFLGWLRTMWLDLLTMAVLGFATLGIYSAPLAATRTFPVTFTDSGDIVFPSLAYPERGWIISSGLSACISAFIPIVFILLAQIRVRSFWDANNAIMGVVQALIIQTLSCVIVKHLIGGFRPYFLAVCMPDISLASSHNSTGLNGVGFHEIMYTSEICTQPDKKLLKTAMTSWPSGHAATAFAGFVFLHLYFNAKLKVWAAYRPAFWKVALTIAPLLGAFLKACVLTIDQAHHWYDILAGSIIGTGAAVAAYRGNYAAIWDWRFNHIPLQRNEDFAYTLDKGYGPRDGVFTRSAGWAKSSEAIDEKPLPPSGRSSATYAPRMTGNAAVGPDRNLQVPDTTASRPRHAPGHNIRGDEMV
ncbi:hypothetical protein D7B24_000349 [Verticillium nonalfalfae]|uniref:Phosphatidic acid phosphatase type 2/haloperoxidase domain-containing protein n=1 Tax=Verticillium nonalfalfae TaxID=1051616 RepID=A0A3M9Y238_9PEZI|nr:uncharacterized protein D7B24_000349 [Verticillium nonalfalfae]RNJ54569.1 hypothetical protein D7B24_000349 [Verticillium nonalfalfae]